MKKIIEGLLSLILLIPYLFLFYQLIRIFYIGIISESIINAIILFIMGLGLFFVMLICTLILFQDFFISIKNK